MLFLRLRLGKLHPGLAFGRRLMLFPQPTGNLLLQHLQRNRWSAPDWFAHQQVNVLRHHHESEKQEIPLGAHPVENFHKAVTRTCGSQKWLPAVTTERYKVQIAPAAKSFQWIAHESQNPHP